MGCFRRFLGLSSLGFCAISEAQGSQTSPTDDRNLGISEDLTGTNSELFLCFQSASPALLTQTKSQQRLFHWKFLVLLSIAKSLPWSQGFDVVRIPQPKSKVGNIFLARRLVVLARRFLEPLRFCSETQRSELWSTKIWRSLWTFAGLSRFWARLQNPWATGALE